MRASLVVFAMQRQTSQDPSRNSDTSAALGRGWICLLVPRVVETRVDVNRSHASTHAYIVHTHARPRRRRKKSLMRERKREKRFLLSCCCCCWCNTTIWRPYFQRIKQATRYLLMLLFGVSVCVVVERMEMVKLQFIHYCFYYVFLFGNRIHGKGFHEISF